MHLFKLELEMMGINTYNNNDLSVIKKDLLELKKTIEINTNLLNEILLRIK